MPEASKTTLKARTDNHSDAASSPAAKSLQVEMGERQLGSQLIRRLRETKGALTLSKFEEEWHDTADGVMLELSVDLTETAPDE